MSSTVNPWAHESGPAECSRMTDDEYFGAYDQFLTAHKLKTFDESPLKFRWSQEGLLPRRDSKDFIFGRACHVLTLEGPKAFDERYRVGDGPINPKTEKPYGRDSQKFADWLQEVTADGHEIVSELEYEKLLNIEQAVWTNEPAVAILDDEAAEKELVVRAKLLGVECQSRIDWIDHRNRLIIDLKTTAELGKPPESGLRNPCDFLRRDCEIYGYHRQLAFYRMMARQISGCDYRVAIIAVEKEAPFEVGVFEYSTDTLAFYESLVAASIVEYRKALETGFESRFDQVYEI